MDDHVMIDVEQVIKETPKALVCKLCTGEVETIPKSLIADYSDVHYENDSGELWVARWFAEKNCLE